MAGDEQIPAAGESTPRINVTVHDSQGIQIGYGNDQHNGGPPVPPVAPGAVKGQAIPAQVTAQRAILSR